jgi:hypothetical protein
MGGGVAASPPSIFCHPDSSQILLRRPIITKILTLYGYMTALSDAPCWQPFLEVWARLANESRGGVLFTCCHWSPQPMLRARNRETAEATSLHK